MHWFDSDGESNLRIKEDQRMVRKCAKPTIILGPLSTLKLWVARKSWLRCRVCELVGVIKLVSQARQEPTKLGLARLWISIGDRAALNYLTVASNHFQLRYHSLVYATFPAGFPPASESNMPTLYYCTFGQSPCLYSALPFRLVGLSDTFNDTQWRRRINR